MNFLTLLNIKFGNFYADDKDLEILNNLEVISVVECESKQRYKK